MFFGVREGLTKGVLSRWQIPSPARAALRRAPGSRGSLSSPEEFRPLSQFSLALSRAPNWAPEVGGDIPSV